MPNTSRARANRPGRAAVAPRSRLSYPAACARLRSGGSASAANALSASSSGSTVCPSLPSRRIDTERVSASFLPTTRSAGTFISEWLLLRDAFVGGVWPAAVVVIIGLTVTFVALSMQLSRVVFGQAPLSMRIIPAISARALAVVPFILLFIALITGLAIAPPVMTTLTTLAKGGALLP